jgi:hypothetical protein
LCSTVTTFRFGLGSKVKPSKQKETFPATAEGFFYFGRNRQSIPVAAFSFDPGENRVFARLLLKVPWFEMGECFLTLM